jgi:hypothetical protein
MRMNARRWSVALVIICAAWLCCLLFEPEQPAAHGDTEPVTLARQEMRSLLGLTSIVDRERNRVAGRVLDGERGVADALICASCVACEATSAPAAQCTRSQKDGAYAFSDLPVGGYFIAASAAGYAPGEAHAGAPIYLRGQESLSDVDIVLEKGGARVNGSVVDATGGPVAHARVRAIRLQSPRLSLDLVTDADGHFELWVQPGFIALSAEAEGYARAIQRTTAPTEVELRLVPGGSIEGVVVSASDKLPLAAVDVRAAPPENPQLAMACGSLSDERGHFRIEGLEPGAYRDSDRARARWDDLGPSRRRTPRCARRRLGDRQAATEQSRSGFDAHFCTGGSSAAARAD